MSHTTIYVSTSKTQVEGTVAATAIRVGQQIEVTVDRREGTDDDGVSRKRVEVKNVTVGKSLVTIELDIPSDDDPQVGINEWVKLG